MTNGHYRLLTCVLSCVTLFVAALAAPPATAAPRSIPAAGYGFGDGAQTTWLDGDEANRELDAVARTNATWFRVLVPWAQIEQSRGQYDWAQTDMIIDAARTRNLKVLGVISYTPAWAKPPGTSLSTPPDNAADFANFGAAAAKHYGSRVSTWQLWNEPNLPMFFGDMVNSASRYSEMVKAAYPAIKAALPSSSVILAGLSRLPGDDSPPSYLNKMYAAGIKGNFDAAAAHPYVFPTGLAADPENGWSDVQKMRDIMISRGDGSKKIWLTEFGAPTCDCSDGVSQGEQGKQILDVLAAAAATNYSGPAFIYSIRDTDTTNRGDRETNFGALLTSDWQPKMAASLLAR
ncbi:cellulase family glycosylhydrolase [Mycobacterium sp. NPDC006124]|uniref:cellulase family glycosylhydrolase n=1 Tax=Mycobacterium sp. NPDC006124 TaxID=3156729 RepID=UPI0033BF618D